MKQIGKEDRFVQALKGVQYIVINKCFGGFGVSELALDRYYQYTGTRPSEFERDDPTLVRIVRELGDEANGGYAKLHIVEIPGDVAWQIEEYDGNEWVAEQHRTWG